MISEGRIINIARFCADDGYEYRHSRVACGAEAGAEQGRLAGNRFILVKKA